MCHQLPHGWCAAAMLMLGSLQSTWGADTTPPALDVTSLVLKGPVDGTGSAPAVTVNGQPATVTGSQWQREEAVAGSVNQFAVAATDKGGNTAGLNVRVTVKARAARGDLSGDGKADILLRHPGSGEVLLWLME